MWAHNTIFIANWPMNGRIYTYTCKWAEMIVWSGATCVTTLKIPWGWKQDHNVKFAGAIQLKVALFYLFSLDIGFLIFYLPYLSPVLTHTIMYMGGGLKFIDAQDLCWLSHRLLKCVRRSEYASWIQALWNSDATKNSHQMHNILYVLCAGA